MEWEHARSFRGEGRVKKRKYHISLLHFEAGFLTEPGVHFARLAGQQSTGIFLSLLLPHWDYRHALPCLTFYFIFCMTSGD